MYMYVYLHTPLDNHIWSKKLEKIYSALYKTGKEFERSVKLNDKELNLEVLLERFEDVGNNEIIDYVLPSSKTI